MLPPSQTWLPPRRLLPLFATLSTLPLADSSRVLGTLILGAPGAGKTVLESLCLLVDLLRGLPGVVLDPLGTLSDAFLFRLAWFLSEFATRDDEFLCQRLRYIELGGDFVTPFPIYFQRDGESLWDTGNRLITVLERSSPQLVTGAPLTWPAARTLARNAGMVLTALSLQLDKVEDLLFNTLEWHNNGTFQESINCNPQAKDAVSYFRNYYLTLPRSEQRRIAGTFLDQVSPLIQNPQLRAIFSGSTTPGIDWEEEEALGRKVVINGKGITDPASRSFALHWILESLLTHLKARGRREIPFVVTIDEFAHLAQAGTGENKPLADLFDEFLAQYARNNRVFVTVALQSVDQVDERLARTLFRMGTLISGRAGSFREARIVADHLFRKDINRVQHYKKVWGKVDPPPYSLRYSASYHEFLTAAMLANPKYPYYVLDTEPQFMGLDLQEEEAAGMIQKLGALEFLCRPALREGAVSQEVVPLFIADAITDPDSGEYSFPDPDQDHALIAQVQHRLAARSGVPMAEILKEQASALPASPELQRGEPKQDYSLRRQENRLTKDTPQKSTTAQSGGELDGRQPSAERLDGRQEDPAHPEPRKAKETQSHPTLNDQQKAMLAFLSEHPDMPVSSVYKGLGVSVRKGTEIRDRLKEQGFLLELELKPTSPAGGRPMKCLLPTLQAFALLGKDPPKGRGGSVHRNIQQLVAEGGRAKGYTAKLEHKLGSGGIVDVHLEGKERIAVEIAVLSTPQREISHIRECLQAGYDMVYTLFCDESLLTKTAMALKETCAAEEAGRVRLLPVGMLAVLSNS